MKISILGTGMVGQVLSGRLASEGYKVYMGTRDPEEKIQDATPNNMTGQSFKDWYSNNKAVNVVRNDALPEDSAFFINATNGFGSIEALKLVGERKLKNKIIIDVANPLDFSKGMPPSLFLCNTDSLAEEIQKTFPDSKVVKSLNTMNAYLMLNPKLIEGNHTVFVSGNDAGAKGEVINFLNSMGWNRENIIDLGDITTARGTEMLLPIWIRLYGALGTPEFNFHIVKK